MMNQSLIFLIFFIDLILIFFTSRYVIDEIFHFLRLFIKNDRKIFIIVSLFFLPGTIIHELAHFFMAAILLLKVKEVNILPALYHQFIKLGSVTYEKKDPIRGILVGIAPLFVGLIFFYLVNVSNIFQSQNHILNVFFIYLIFSISSTMFSSKQDLVDMVFIIPLIIILVVVSYVYQIKIGDLIINKIVIDSLASFFVSVNKYLFLSLLINLLLLIVFKGLRIILRK